MFTQMKDHLAKQLAEIKANGLYKVERTIITPQSSAIRIAERSGKVLNFCANNYLGLSDNPRLISAAKKAMDSHGFGMSSVRFICGAQDLHRELEKAIAPISIPRTRFSMQLVSMPTEAYSNPYSPKRMPSSRMLSTMHRS